jgi:hypothetical protein
VHRMRRGMLVLFNYRNSLVRGAAGFSSTCTTVVKNKMKKNDVNNR